MICSSVIGSDVNAVTTQREQILDSSVVTHFD